MNTFLKDNLSKKILGTFGQLNSTYKFGRIKDNEERAKILLKSKGLKVINLSNGNSSQGSDRLLNTIFCNINREIKGKGEIALYSYDDAYSCLIDTMLQYLIDLFDVKLQQSQILISNGSKTVIALLSVMFVDQGDIVITTSPGFPLIDRWTEFLGGKVIKLPLLKENYFLPDFKIIKAEELKKAKILYLNYPNNPTGAIANTEFYKKVVDFAIENRILIISDLTYGPLVYRGKPPMSILSIPKAKSCAVEIHSLSKGFEMADLRLNWLIGNPFVVNILRSIHGNLYTRNMNFIYHIAAMALRNCKSIIPSVRRKYLRRLNIISKVFNEVGFETYLPEGTPYLYFKAPKVVDGIQFSSAEDFANWFLYNKGISVVPWDDVGSYIRVSVVLPTVRDKEEEAFICKELKNRLINSNFIF